MLAVASALCAAWSAWPAALVAVPSWLAARVLAFRAAISSLTTFGARPECRSWVWSVALFVVSRRCGFATRGDRAAAAEPAFQATTQNAPSAATSAVMRTVVDIARRKPSLSRCAPSSARSSAPQRAPSTVRAGGASRSRSGCTPSDGSWSSLTLPAKASPWPLHQDLGPKTNSDRMFALPRFVRFRAGENVPLPNRDSIGYLR